MPGAPLTDTESALAHLRSPHTVRARCQGLLALAEEGRLRHFRVRPERLEPTARYVAQITCRDYPDLRVPPHSRWRHFNAGGVDRLTGLKRALGPPGSRRAARAGIDLAVTSVLLDAGAGAAWRYREPDTGAVYARSEGLAVASLHLFRAGAFSSDPGDPHRVDADGLAGLSASALRAGFQVGPSNPLVGFEARLGMLRALGDALREHPEMFGADPPRPGGLLDHLADAAHGGELPLGEILDAVLRGLEDIWPGRLVLGGRNLGDVWRHPAVRTGDLTDGMVPFHKLGQWLTYSLMEPVEEAGLRLVEVETLTGLAEYRNGGLFLDLGVLEPLEPAVLKAVHAVGDEPVVEWRALTVALLDRLAGEVRRQLGGSGTALPLASILQGGTWAAGRRIAHERREGGAPPLHIASDGTVF